MRQIDPSTQEENEESAPLETPQRRGWKGPLPIPISRLTSGTQAGLVLLFSCTYFGITLILLLSCGHGDLMGAPMIWIIALILGFAIWLSFNARRRFLNLLTALGNTAPKPNPPSQIREEKLATVHVPWRDTLRIVALSIDVIFMAAWFTTYSGGPFISPFGQFLLAIPLLAVTLSSRRGMIAAVSVVTLAAAFGAQWIACGDIRRWFGSSSEMCPASPLSTAWYVYASTATIVVSAFLAELTGRFADSGQARRLFPWWYITRNANGNLRLIKCDSPECVFERVTVITKDGDSNSLEPNSDGVVDLECLEDDSSSPVTLNVTVRPDNSDYLPPSNPVILIPDRVVKDRVLLAGVVFKFSAKAVEESNQQEDSLSAKAYATLLRKLWSD